MSKRLPAILALAVLLVSSALMAAEERVEYF
jgi:hypothetical protein